MSDSSVGRTDFAQRLGLETPEREAEVEQVLAQCKADGIELVRLSFVDQHGVLRGKTLPLASLGGAMRNGCTMTSSLLLKDTSHRTVFPIWTSEEVLGSDELVGAGDIVMLPDPTTYRRLPWSPKTGWVLCDIYLAGGEPVVVSTRQLLRNAVARLTDAGYAMQAGLEVEFHVFKLEDAHLDPASSGQPPVPPSVSLTTHGYQYLTESRADEMEPVTEIIRAACAGLGLPLRSIEVEFGPSQYELTFEPGDPMAQADAMVLFRSAVKQACRRAGYHATFMCRPGLPNLFSSGWHLHQSLVDATTGRNVLAPDHDEAILSMVGRQFLAGLLRHTPEAMVLTTPTINGYKRYRPMAMAPDRLVWSRDNKGALLRVIGGADDPATRIENRIGEPAANPYLYLAAQIETGLAGIVAGEEPPAPTMTPYQAPAAGLPENLWEATQAFKHSELFRERFGGLFVDYLSTIKEAEFRRFMSEVTDWEHREYFSDF